MTTNDKPTFAPIRKLADAITLFPHLAELDQDRLLIFYSALIFFAPKTMSEPFYLGSTLTSLASSDRADVNMIRAILDVERSYVNQAPSRMA
jgi:hypothetical protein